MSQQIKPHIRILSSNTWKGMRPSLIILLLFPFVKLRKHKNGKHAMVPHRGVSQADVSSEVFI